MRDGDWAESSLPATGARAALTAVKAPPRGMELRGHRILIVDDYALYRDNLAAALTMHGAVDLRLAWDWPSLVMALDDAETDIALVNVATHEGVSLIRAAKDLSSRIRMIVLGVPEDVESEIVACAEAGVDGYHMRSESFDDLLALVQRVAADESVCSPRVAAILAKRLSALAAQRRPPAPRELVLTARETQILTMLEMGLSNREIAAQLCIAVHTVKNHLHSLLKKLGVSTRTDAAALSRALR